MLSGCVVVGLILSQVGCRHRPPAAAPVSDLTLAPPPQIVSDAGDIKTVAEYQKVIESALSNPPTGRTDQQLLADAIASLSAMPSESARIVARALREVAISEGIAVGRSPGKGKPTLTNRELAEIDACCFQLITGFFSNMKSQPARRGNLATQISDEIMLSAPGDMAAACAVFAGLSSMAGAETPPENGDSKHVDCARTFRHYRARLNDPNRPITLSTTAMLSAKGELISPDGFLFTLYAFANALSVMPRDDVQAREISPVLTGFRELYQRAAEADPTLRTQAEKFATDINLTAFAEMMDENVVVAQAVRPTIDQFVKALAEGDDAAIAELSSDVERRTAAQWRKEFRLDPNANAPLEWKYSTAGRGWRDMWVVLRRAGEQEWNYDHAADLSFRQMRGHWTVTAYPDGDREAATTRPWLLPPDERKGDPTTRYAPKSDSTDGDK